jgi:hypothetical protein
MKTQWIIAIRKSGVIGLSTFFSPNFSMYASYQLEKRLLKSLNTDARHVYPSWYPFNILYLQTLLVIH